MKNNKALLSIVALAAVLMLGLLVSIAGAAPTGQTQTPGSETTPNRAVQLIGRVESLTADGFVMTTRRGEITVRVSDRTFIAIEKVGNCAEGALRDVQTGKPAHVVGVTTPEQGVVAARSVMQCPGAINDQGGKPGHKGRHGFAAKHFAAGSVKAVNGSMLTVTNLRGKELTVNTTAETIVFNNGFQSVASVKVGDKVQLFGHPDKPAQAGEGNKDAAARTVTAWALRVESAGTRMAIGRVESVNGDTVMLKTPKNRDGITVTLSGASFRAMTIADKKATLSSASQADVKAGSNLVIEGVDSGDGKGLTAKAVIIMSEGKNKLAKP